MTNSKPTEIVRKIRKKNICSFLATVFCTLVIVSSIGTEKLTLFRDTTLPVDEEYTLVRFSTFIVAEAV
jgi:hypothetical protein